MRALSLLVVLTAGCAIFDPIEDVPSTHAIHVDTKAAITAILEAERGAKVFAVGEFHPQRTSGKVRTPITRFTDEIVTLLKPHARDLVVESWLDDCGAASLQPQLDAAMQRPSAAADVQRLAMESMKLSIRTRGLSITCLEHQAMRDPTGSIDFFRLLQLITHKLQDAAAATLDGGAPSVIVYGGALHNDLYPRWPLDSLTYAAPLEARLGEGRVLELDLVVPEVVASIMAVRMEPWFPLLGLASPSRVIVWKRAAHSYVVILPAQSEDVAKIARAPSS